MRITADSAVRQLVVVLPVWWAALVVPAHSVLGPAWHPNNRTILMPHQQHLFRTGWQGNSEDKGMETTAITSRPSAHGEGSRRHFYLHFNSSSHSPSPRKATQKGTVLSIAASSSSSSPGNLIMSLYFEKNAHARDRSSRKLSHDAYSLVTLA